MTARRVCKDCGVGPRPAPFPGPRCATHDRERRKAVSAQAHGRRVEALYGITPAQYDALKLAQGGRCYVCQRATGARRRLAVDHDHALAAQHDHPTEQACALCVRGLACSWCNHEVLGRLGDDPATYERIAALLRTPPSVCVIRPTTKEL